MRRWDVATRADVRIATHCFPSTSTGSGVAGVAVTEGRALWLTYIGGNIREWTLWTKRGSARAKRIAFRAADVDGPAPIVLGHAWEGSLPYAVGGTIVVLRPDGSRHFSLVAPAAVRTLTANSRGYAAVLADGSVLRISLTGRVLGQTPFAPGLRSVRPARGTGPDREDDPGARDPSRQHCETNPAAGRFAVPGLLGVRRRVRLGQAAAAAAALGDGKDVLFRTLTPGFSAQMGRKGVVYASGRTLGYAARVIVSSAFRIS